MEGRYIDTFLKKVTSPDTTDIGRGPGETQIVRILQCRRPIWTFWVLGENYCQTF